MGWTHGQNERREITEDIFKLRSQEVAENEEDHN